MTALAETSAAQERQPARVRAGLSVLSLSMLLSSLATSSANVSLPALMKAFDASLPSVQWVVLAYLLAITSFIVSAGRVGDLIGRKRLFTVGLALFAAASLACALAPSLGALIAARAVQGAAAAVMMALTMAMASGMVPKERTGSVVGLLGTMSAIGTALGPTLGGLLIDVLGWRAIFGINVPLGVAALVLALIYLPRDAYGSGKRSVSFDVPGTILLATALSALALSVTSAGGSTVFNSAIGVAGAVALAGFIAIEARARSPLVPLPLFRLPVLSSGFVMSALATSVVMATLVVGPFYLSAALGLSSSQMGLVMSCGPLVAAITGMPSGWLVDRMGTVVTIRLGLFAMLGGTVAMALLAGGYDIPGYVAPLAVITAGYALFQTANNAAVMISADVKQKGVISALVNLSRNIGLIAGTSVMGAIFGAASGQGGGGHLQPDAATAGFVAVFWTAALVLVIALAASALARRYGRP